MALTPRVGQASAAVGSPGGHPLGACGRGARWRRRGAGWRGQASRRPRQKVRDRVYDDDRKWLGTGDGGEPAGGPCGLRGLAEGWRGGQARSFRPRSSIGQGEKERRYSLAAGRPARLPAPHADGPHPRPLSRGAGAGGTVKGEDLRGAVGAGIALLPRGGEGHEVTGACGRALFFAGGALPGRGAPWAMRGGCSRGGTGPCAQRAPGSRSPALEQTARVR